MAATTNQVNLATHEQAFYDSWYGKIYDFFKNLLSWLFSFNESTYERQQLVQSYVTHFLNDKASDILDATKDLTLKTIKQFINDHQDQCEKIIRDIFLNTFEDHQLEQSKMINFDNLLTELNIDSSHIFDTTTTQILLLKHYNESNNKEVAVSDKHEPLKNFIFQFTSPEYFLEITKNEIDPKVIKFYIEFFLSLPEWKDTNNTRTLLEMCSHFWLHFFSTKNEIDLSFLSQVEGVSLSILFYVYKDNDSFHFSQLLDYNLLDTNLILFYVNQLLGQYAGTIEEFDPNKFRLLQKAYDILIDRSDQFFEFSDVHRHSDVTYIQEKNNTISQEINFTDPTDPITPITAKLAHFLLLHAIHFQFIKNEEIHVNTLQQLELLSQCMDLEQQYQSLATFNIESDAYQPDGLKSALFSLQYEVFKHFGKDQYPISNSIAKGYLPFFLQKQHNFLDEITVCESGNDVENEQVSVDENDGISQVLAQHIPSAEDFLALVTQDTDTQQALSVLNYVEFEERDEVKALMTFKSILEDAKSFNTLQEFEKSCPNFVSEKEIITLWNKYSTFLNSLPKETIYQLAFYSKLLFDTEHNKNLANKKDVYRPYLESLKEGFDDRNIISTYELTQESNFPKYLMKEIRLFLFSRLLKMDNKEQKHFKLIDDLYLKGQYDFKALAGAMDQIRYVQFASVSKRVIDAKQRPIVEYGKQFANLVQNCRTNATISLDFPNEFILFFKDHAFFILSTFVSCLNPGENLVEFLRLIRDMRSVEIEIEQSVSNLIEDLKRFLESFSSIELTPQSVKKFFELFDTKPSQIFAEQLELKLSGQLQSIDLNQDIKHILSLINTIIETDLKPEFKNDVCVDEVTHSDKENQNDNASNVTTRRGSDFGMFKKDSVSEHNENDHGVSYGLEGLFSPT
ncbi:MAG: hypothetical protein CMF42_02420 [Legionellales bacterium]|nr:hypothetical protein [Legionellales bacterium]|tara:strand:- start:4879 stop:7605 length:2727 start_codon:yes stop_codon:yes gene_type:complete